MYAGEGAESLDFSRGRARADGGGGGGGVVSGLIRKKRPRSRAWRDAIEPNKISWEQRQQRHLVASGCITFSRRGGAKPSMDLVDVVDFGKAFQRHLQHTYSQHKLHEPRIC